MSHDELTDLARVTPRELAEQELSERPRPAPPAPGDPAALLYELQVHQVELEHQNEELRRAVLEAEEARARYEDLFDFAPIGYFTFDPQGVVREANLTGCAMLGVGRRSMLGRRFLVFVEPSFRGHFTAVLKRVFASPDKRVVEIKLLRPDGTDFYVQLECVVPEQGGHAHHCRAAVMDISVQKQVQEEVMSLNQTLEERVQQRSARVRELNEELERFTYDVANDLQAPLRHIQSFAALLRESHTPTGGQEERYLEHIVRSAGRMQALSGALLEFSRASRMRVRLSPVPLDQVVREVWKKLESQARGREVRLIHDPLPVVQADAGAMQVVVRHLLSNALKFTREVPEALIQVFAQETGAEFVLGVRDNGVGFNMRYRDRLFRVFQRLHSERDFEGTGVGLAIVRRVVSRYGGRVWAEGKVGEGATFYLALPREPRDLT